MVTHNKRKKNMASAITASKDTAGSSYRSDGAGEEEKSQAMAGAKKIHGRGVSIMAMSAFHSQSSDPSTRNMPPNFHDTSMDELASRLLDDSNLSQFEVHAGRRLSQKSIVNALQHLPGTPHVHKDLPQLPQLLFNNDDAWAMQFRSAETAEGDSNAVGFDGDEPSTHLQGELRVSFNKRKSSVPTLPIKSSRRAAARDRHRKRATLRTAEACRIREKKISISSPILLEAIPSEQSRDTSVDHSIPLSMTSYGSDIHSSLGHDTPASLGLAAVAQNPQASTLPQGKKKPMDVNAKIQAMLAATDQLKGKKENSEVIQTPTNKFNGKYIFARVKSAFSTHRNDHWKKQHDPARDDRLLDEYLNQTPELDMDEEPSLASISAVESCVNEGLNLNRVKVRALTGHGNVVRKPLPDDGKSLRSHNSLDDPFTASNLRNEIPDNLDKYPPLIPQSGTNSAPSSPVSSSAITPKSPPTISKISTSSCSPSSSLLPFYSEALDDTIPSSPDDMSTPENHRYKLASTVGGDGVRRMMVVSRSTPSLLDRNEFCSALAMPYRPRQARSEPMPSAFGPNDIELQEISRLAAPEEPSRRKKHPSPSKSELEALGRGLSSYSVMMTASPPRPFPAGKALAAKDTNLVGSHTPRGLRGASEGNLAADAKNRKEPAELPRRMALTAASAEEEQPIRRPPPALHIDSSMLESSTDELQWNVDTYHVGMRRR